ncbi:MAG: AMP-binding protein [Brevundimonas sp.]|uniref:AMP-binding protein n=1 Tax=Brevundimonas sp. TaxID=1871086 RepID=UPI00271FDEC1|nr:AMP-binding protein [Brevundimonas sp.]MDO9077862.1 AMP-binding protein [Brevundimonas sp.]MDP3079678.1 AMP-binding protein [Brevundimonas sp.]MDZ4063016.1 AMP-binding protein [Brevundimonas sp.]
MLAELLRDRFLQRPDQTIVTVCGGRGAQPDQALSGRELHQAALARSVLLSRRYAPFQGPLALAMPCGMEFVVTLFGALYAGFTVTAVAPPRPGVHTSRFQAIIRDCGPAAILCPQDWVSRLEGALAGTDKSVPVVDVDALALSEAPLVSFEPASVMDTALPAILQYTSGSTRAPKAVVLSGANIVANAGLANGTWGMDESGVFLSWLPHFHDMGLMGGILYPILAGGRTVLLDPLQMIQRPERWLRCIETYGVTMSGGPAFAFSHCLQQVNDAQCEGLDLSSWRSAFCGAEPVPAALMDAFRARFEPYGLNPNAVFGSYGLAEYTLMVAGGNARPGADRPTPPTGCGEIEPCRISPEMQDNLRLVDPDTRRMVAAGEQGEIWLKGPSTAQGYRNEPEETAATFGAVLSDDEAAGNWLRTGDIAVREGDWLFVTGRLKDLLFANGRKIPATDLEWLAGEQDEALNPMAAAALMPDDLHTGKAVLLIELKRRAFVADEQVTRDRIRRAVAGAWGIELTDIRILASGSLPRTSSGKIRRREVADAWRERRLDEALQ